MLANSEFIIMLNQGGTDREDLANLLQISETQMTHITNVDVGHGLIKVGSNLVPFERKFPKNTELYKLMSTKMGEAYYGTLRCEIERFSDDNPLFLIVDTHGKHDICLSYPLTKSIFIMPSSLDVLRERMISRGENTEEEIENRLKDAKWEIERSKYYNYVIINDGDVDEAVDTIIKILNNKDELG